MERANQNLRQQIREHDLHNWEVAEMLGVSEFTFSRWLRHELSPERREAIEAALARLKEGTLNGAND